jgi:hypothetical protein
VYDERGQDKDPVVEVDDLVVLEAELVERAADVGRRLLERWLPTSDSRLGGVGRVDPLDV